MTELNHDILAALSALDQQLDPDLNRNERVHVLILACLDHDLITVSVICAYLIALDFKPGHIAKRLEGGVTRAPAKDHWGQRADGTFFAHSMPAD